MKELWDYYWPAITAALVIGALAGSFAFRRPIAANKVGLGISARRRTAFVAGIALALAAGAIWHGPLGAGKRFAIAVERQSRRILDDFEMTKIQAELEHAPLSRTLVLSGPADDFQRGELVRIMNDAPGVGSVRWSDMRKGGTLPLIVEAELSVLAGFGLGLLLSYLLEMRRRSRAEWRW
jgi:hypothetical protein